jgi:hypothetical protein
MDDQFDELSDEELGRLIREALKVNNEEKIERAATRMDLATFLQKVGLTAVASAICELAEKAWEALRIIIFG